MTSREHLLHPGTFLVCFCFVIFLYFRMLDTRLPHSYTVFQCGSVYMYVHVHGCVIFSVKFYWIYWCQFIYTTCRHGHAVVGVFLRTQQVSHAVEVVVCWLGDVTRQTAQRSLLIGVDGGCLIECVRWRHCLSVAVLFRHCYHSGVLQRHITHMKLRK